MDQSVDEFVVISLNCLFYLIKQLPKETNINITFCFKIVIEKLIKYNKTYTVVLLGLSLLFFKYWFRCFTENVFYEKRNF